MSDLLKKNGAAAEEICLKCGLCCNGVIFAHVKLPPGDDAAALRSRGIPVTTPNSAVRVPRFHQPCPAYCEFRCRIYAERPKYCREFECLLLKNVKAGQTPAAKALQTIRSAQDRASRVRRLLQALGDADEGTALSVRFRRTARRMEEIGLDGESATIFGELTLAVHDLNLLLSERFYPGR